MMKKKKIILQFFAQTRAQKNQARTKWIYTGETLERAIISSLLLLRVIYIREWERSLRIIWFCSNSLQKASHIHKTTRTEKGAKSLV